MSSSKKIKASPNGATQGEGSKQTLKVSLTAAELKNMLLELHRKLESLDPEEYFAEPVDVADAPFYEEVVKQPMDFRTIRTKIEDGKYLSLKKYKEDFVLVCKNAMLYNEDDSDIYLCAHRILSLGVKEIKRFKAKLVTIGAGVNESPSQKSEKSEKSDKDFSPAALRSLGRVDQQNQSLYLARMDNHDTTSLGFLTSRSCTKEIPRLKSLVELERTESSSTKADIYEYHWNSATPVTSLRYGSFTSFAPSFDSSQANLSVTASDMLFSTFDDDMMEGDAPSGCISGKGYACRVLNTISSMGSSSKKRDEEIASLLSLSEKDYNLTALKNKNKVVEPPHRRGMDFEDLIESIGDPPTDETPTAEVLKYNAKLLGILQQIQKIRYQSATPDNIGDEEASLARLLKTSLKLMAGRSNPGDLVSMEAIHSAIGVKFLGEETTGEEPKPNTPLRNKSKRKRKREESLIEEADADTDGGEDKEPEIILVMTCENCKGSGPRWSGPVYGIEQQLCQVCGFHAVLSRWPRPVEFDHPLNDEEVTMITAQLAERIARASEEKLNAEASEGEADVDEQKQSPEGNEANKSADNVKTITDITNSMESDDSRPREITETEGVNEQVMMEQTEAATKEKTGVAKENAAKEANNSTQSATMDTSDA